MSLNRHEQMVFDYVQKHPEERRHWESTVKTLGERERDPHAASMTLEADIWQYFVERSGVVSPFKDVAAREGLRRTSMRNLAELWLRLWGPVRPKRERAPGEGPVPYA